MKPNNHGSTVYWKKLAKVQRFVDINKIPQEELLEIEKSNVSNTNKIPLLEKLCKKYNLKLV